METSLSHCPELSTLTLGLTSVLGSDGATPGPVIVLHRETGKRTGTHPSEVVTCRLGDGSELQLFCKYAAGRSHNAHGHRPGLAYEVEVYRHVLQPRQVSTPRFYGTHTDATGETWLVIEYLAGSERLVYLPGPEAISRAARWLGEFHAANEARLSRRPIPFLTSYDAGYYRGWADRTSRYAAHRHQRFPWLAPLCQRFEAVVDALLARPATVIHGEYTVKNILLRGGTVYPVDWESAAIALGEIDLVSLTDHWPAEIAAQCEREYRAARWPAGAPSDFERRLDLARLYVQFRWLGEQPEWTTREKLLWRFEELRCAGERLGLL
jgi:hypothetical protein